MKLRPVGGPKIYVIFTSVFFGQVKVAKLLSKPEVIKKFKSFSQCIEHLMDLNVEKILLEEKYVFLLHV